jgi:putative transposase
LAGVLEVPVSTVGRWAKVPVQRAPQSRRSPEETDLREKIKALCLEPRHRTFGHRHIKALLRRVHGLIVNRKRVLRVMRHMGLTQPKIRHREARPKRVEKMRPAEANRAWQIDMTSLRLSDMTPLFLIVIIDCYTRQIVGWDLDRRCRACEWTSAVRMALEARGLVTKESCEKLTLRSDNGCQPCSKKFRAYLSEAGVRPQYTGYDAPDDNAYVERVIRTIKQEEIWCNLYEKSSEASKALEEYINYYNHQRIHSALDYQTPDEVNATAILTLAAA